MLFLICCEVNPYGNSLVTKAYMTTKINNNKFHVSI